MIAILIGIIIGNPVVVPDEPPVGNGIGDMIIGSSFIIG